MKKSPVSNLKYAQSLIGNVLCDFCDSDSTLHSLLMPCFNRLDEVISILRSSKDSNF